MDLIDVIKTGLMAEDYPMGQQHGTGSGNREAWSMSGAIDELDGTAVRVVR